MASPVPRESCAVCFNLQPETLQQVREGQKATLFVQPRELIESVRNTSCHECKLLSDVVSTSHNEWTKDSQSIGLIQLDLANGHPLHVRYRATNEESANSLQVYQNGGLNDALIESIPGTIGRAPEIPESSKSAESIALVKEWHRECSSKHALCKTDPEPSMPTRLLDVSKQDLILVETSGISNISYVALSYCWGSGPTHPKFCTTRDNFKAHRASIDSHSLPVALQDAVGLTRELGFSYIWIDALCIIQDDGSDWAREAKTMCQVYSQAALTIIGSRSDGTGTSLFGHQSFSNYKTIEYRGVPLRVRTNIQRDHQLNPGVPSFTIDPITKRAWALQEAVLSNRAVYFTSEELRWECNTRCRCQCGRIDMELPSTYDVEHLQYESYRTWRLDGFFPHSVQDAYNMWQSVLTFYTKRSLTQHPDRLVALSGLAQRFQAAMWHKHNKKATYLGGLWKEAMPQQLLWRVDAGWSAVDPGNKHEQPSSWRAPSWSWASLEAPTTVEFNAKMQSLIEILAHEMEPATIDPFGQLKSGFLRVSAPILRDVRLVADPAMHFTNQQRYRAAKWQGLELRVSRTYMDKSLATETEVDVLADSSGLLCLLVVGYSEDGDVHQCLGIVPVAGKTQTFERVGLISLGQHFRGPEGNAAAIERAPIEKLTLV